MSVTKFSHTPTNDYTLSSSAAKEVIPTICYWWLLPTVEATRLIAFRVSGIANVIHVTVEATRSIAFRVSGIANVIHFILLILLGIPK
jgi:hypothetical protein